MLSKDLLHTEIKEDAETWVDSFVDWMATYSLFLSQMTIDDFGNSSYGNSVADIYRRMINAGKHDSSIPRWGDAVVWSELHTSLNTLFIETYHQQFLPYNSYLLGNLLL